MLKSIPWYIGQRYIISKRRNGYIAFVSLFALVGMMLGVFALIVVLSVMNGFDYELKSRILRVVPHGFLTKDEKLTDWASLQAQIDGAEGLLASAPFIEGKALVGFGQRMRGVELQGIAPEEESTVSQLHKSMIAGRLEDLESAPYGVVLGSIVARHLGVTTGDKVALTLPVMSITPAGIFPRSKRFRVVGVFEVGAQVDQSLVLIHIRDAQKLFRLGDEVHGLRLHFDSIYKAPAYLKSLMANLGNEYLGKDWSHTQGSLFQAVKMEKLVVGVMLGVIIAIAAFNIVTSLIMMVAEKRSDIAVLRTLGMQRRDVVKIFMVQGTLMGFSGILVGAIFGILVAQFLPQIMQFFENIFGFQMFDQNVYFVAHLPSVWQWQDTAITCAFALLVSLLATIYPSIRAASIEPAEALRYEI
ncbi:MAG: lipoprotein-releasing ABC transporter permease subunit [Agarilytica sp.]